MQRDAWDRPRPQTAQWALSHTIFPGEVFAKDDPVVRGHIALMQACTQEDIPAETGWLHHEAVWNYNAAFVAEVYLWAGLREWAHRTFTGYLNHASPLHAWREEQPLQHALLGDNWGDMPHNWASAECIRYLRHMLVLEDDQKLRLLDGVLPSDLKVREAFSVAGSPTRFGRISLNAEPWGVRGWKVRFTREGGAAPGMVTLPAKLDAGAALLRVDGAAQRSVSGRNRSAWIPVRQPGRGLGVPRRARSLASHACLNGSIFLAGGWGRGADGVRTDGGGNDEGFGVVHDEGREGSGGAFHDDFSPSTRFSTCTVPACRAGTVPVNQWRRVSMNSSSCSPVRSSRQPSPRANRFDAIDERAAHPFGRSIPLDVGHTVLEMDGPGLSIEAEAAPVPQLEGEDVGRGADFEHHAVFAGAMNGARRNQEMIVLAGGETVDVFLGGEIEIRRFARARRSRSIAVAIDAFLQAQIDAGAFFGVEHVVALVLGVIHAEVFADIGREGMHLKREVAAAHGVEEVEADGKLRAEACDDMHSPSSSRGCTRMRSMAGISTRASPKPSSRLFSSGTQSKHQA